MQVISQPVPPWFVLVAEIRIADGEWLDEYISRTFSHKTEKLWTMSKFAFLIFALCVVTHDDVSGRTIDEMIMDSATDSRECTWIKSIYMLLLLLLIRKILMIPTGAMAFDQGEGKVMIEYDIHLSRDEWMALNHPWVFSHPCPFQNVSTFSSRSGTRVEAGGRLALQVGIAGRTTLFLTSFPMTTVELFTPKTCT